jgi:lipopolysaccharide export system protein LptC
MSLSLPESSPPVPGRVRQGIAEFFRDRFAIWFPLGLVLLLALLTFWLNRMVQEPPPKKDGSGRHDPDYWVENFTATRLGADGKPRHVLTARKMTHYPDDDSTHLEQPRFSGFEAGKAPMHIQARRGLVSRDGEHVHFTGDVVAIREPQGNKSQLSLATSYLHIIPDQDRALTDRAVTIRDANITVTAVGMELNNRTRIIKLFSRVKARYEKPKPKQ